MNTADDKKINSDSSAEKPLKASFSGLIMSLASSSLMWMGVGGHADDNPKENSKIKKDKNLARFNIDLLLILQDKTKGNLASEEAKLLDTIISDLQMRYVNLKDEK